MKSRGKLNSDMSDNTAWDIPVVNGTQQVKIKSHYPDLRHNITWTMSAMKEPQLRKRASRIGSPRCCFDDTRGERPASFRLISSDYK